MHAGAPMRALAHGHAGLDHHRHRATGEPRSPMRAHGTLVEASDAVPRNIPGLTYTAIHTGAAFTDTSVLPAKILGTYPVFVPRADNDGMAIAGIRMLAAGRATRDLHRVESPRGGFFGRRHAVSVAGRCRSVRRHPRRARGIKRSAPCRASAMRTMRSISRRCGPPPARMVAERLLLPQDAERALELAGAGQAVAIALTPI